MILSPVIQGDENNCVNCHQCISVCPVKYCINGSRETVKINHELCIGCGSCIDACTHDAGQCQDDFAAFLADSPMLHTIKLIMEYYPEYASVGFSSDCPKTGRKRSSSIKIMK